jgi:hypothetical protein
MPRFWSSASRDGSAFVECISPGGQAEASLRSGRWQLGAPLWRSAERFTFADRDVSSVGGDSRDCKEMSPRVQQVLASDHL